MLAAAAAAESDAAWSYLSARGARGRDPIKHLDALELDAIRRLRRHDRSGATSAWARLQRMALQSGWRLRAIHAQRQGSVLRGDAPATPPDTMSTEES